MFIIPGFSIQDNIKLENQTQVMQINFRIRTITVPDWIAMILSTKWLSFCFSFWLCKLKLLWKVILFIIPTTNKNLYTWLPTASWLFMWCHCNDLSGNCTVWNLNVSILACHSSLILTKFHFWLCRMRFLWVEYTVYTYLYSFTYNYTLWSTLGKKGHLEKDR